MLRSTASKVMWVGRATVFLVGLSVILALIFGAASAALGANGDSFILGKAANTATNMTGLVGNIADTTKAALSIRNTRGGSALALRVGSPTVAANDVAPMKVNSTKKVDNLNADTLDGLDSTDFQGKYAQTVVVAKSGGDFTSVQAALDSITDASASKHYLVWVGPGTYNERVQMKAFVDIEGAGELATRITASVGGGFAASSSVVSGASDAELRHLTVENTGGTGEYVMAIFNASASPRLSNVTATASGGTDINVGVNNASSSPTMNDVTATASGAGGNAAFGVSNSGGSFPKMTDVTAKGSDAPYNVGINNAGSSPTMNDVSAKAEGGANARGMENSTSSPTLTNVNVGASGGSAENTGVYNAFHSSPTIRESVISASGTASLGVWGLLPNDTTSVVKIENSEVKGVTGTVKAEDGYKVNIGASKLDGGAVSAIGTGSAVKCAGVHDESYVFTAGPACP
ncbi:MAG TPA: pertactin-like passenger domain-containing protein [Rubrobacter sp.]|nr:pertactin-like passenger domain-containing protein [Rubrobacter sp.]